MPSVLLEKRSLVKTSDVQDDLVSTLLRHEREAINGSPDLQFLESLIAEFFHPETEAPDLVTIRSRSREHTRCAILDSRQKRSHSPGLIRNHSLTRYCQSGAPP